MTLPKNDLRNILFEFHPVFLKKEIKCNCEKFTEGWTDRQTEDGRHVTRKFFCSGEINVARVFTACLITYLENLIVSTICFKNLFLKYFGIRLRGYFTVVSLRD